MNGSFATTEAAWFWTIRHMIARRDGARLIVEETPRPFEPDDVVKVLDRCYRQRRIDFPHARILRIWGERQEAPNPKFSHEREDARRWKEAMAALEWPLRVKGIVA